MKSSNYIITAMYAIACLSLFLVTGCFTTNDIVQSTHSYRCSKIVDGAVNIDGKLNEKCWKNAQALEFRRLEDGTLPVIPSCAKLLWDDKYLYVGYEIYDPDVMAYYDGKKRGHTTSDSRKGLSAGEDQIMHQDSFIEFFLDPDGDGKNYIEVHINSINNVADLMLNYPYLYSHKPSHGGFDSRKALGISIKEKSVPDWYWNCDGLKSAVQVNGTLNFSDDKDKGWTTELAIPWESLKPFTKGAKTPALAKNRWRVLLVHVHKTKNRNKKRRHSKNKYASWPVIGILNCHLPERWGDLVFENEMENR